MIVEGLYALVFMVSILIMVFMICISDGIGSEEEVYECCNYNNLPIFREDVYCVIKHEIKDPEFVRKIWDRACHYMDLNLSPPESWSLAMSEIYRDE
jgi:hypothetical protein